MINSNIKTSKDFVSPVENEGIAFNMKEETFYRWVLENAAMLNETMIEAMVSNLKPFGEIGKEYMEDITSVINSNEHTKQLVGLAQDLWNNGDSSNPVPYSQLIKIGYTGEVPNGGFDSPVKSVLENVKRAMFKNRGLSVKSRGKLELNPNVFASYVMSRLTLVQLENEQIYAYRKDGTFDEIKEGVLKSFCYDILHEAKPDTWSASWEGEYYKALKRKIPYLKTMNPRRDYINFKNGMLNLYTMEFTDHSPDFCSTIQIPYEYDINATCPTFEAFLQDVFDGDEEIIQLIQEIMGYCFLPEIKIQMAFFFLGNGSNGKSVLAEVIRQMVGVQNVSNVALNNLNSSFGLQSLPDKLVNISTENEFDRKFGTQNFKIITSGDPVEVKIKYHAPINTVLYATPIVLLNRMMHSEDLSNGYFRRFLIIPFKKVYKELKAGQIPEEGVSYMDKSLTNKLLQELPGIAAFALRGLTRLIDNNFNLTESKACRRALEEYQGRLNPVAEYYNERIYVDSKTYPTLRARFREDFCKWAEENGFDSMKSIGATKFWDLFKNVLQENGVTPVEKKINGYYHVVGVGIRPN
ncbi:DNA primase family protein [Cohnella massiliensis]|uniref:DNA primase family protein n=1 Tax=Cohnella massiliensis TaxID=1816691 RepID=UPI0009BB14A0|nr:DNA primase family protein [Cohnella massiliensis]